MLSGKEHVYLFPAGGSWADTRVLGVSHGRMDRRVCETEGAYTDTTSSTSDFLWAKAYMTAVYLQDRCPYRTVKDMTPETLVGQKPHVDLLKIFGCDDFSHISEDVRKMLDPTAETSVFVGYREAMNANRAFNRSQEIEESVSSSPWL